MPSSLRGKIVLIVVLGTLPIAIFSIIMGINGIRQMTTRIEEDAVNLADTILELYNKKIDEAQLLLTTLSHIPQMQTKEVRVCDQIFKHLFEQAKGYTGFSIATQEGDVLACVPATTGPLNFSDRPWYKSMMETKRFTVCKYQLGRINNKPVQVLSYPIIDEAGEVQAILTAGLDFEWIRGIIEDLEIPKDVIFSICDSEGNIQVRYPNPEKYVGSVIQESFLEKIISSKESRSFLEIDLDGMHRYFGFVDFKSSDRLHYMLVGIPRQYVTDRVNKIMFLAAIFIISILILTSFIAWFAGDMFIVKDIRMLTKAANEFKTGNFSIRAGPKYRKGEIGDLMRSFDSMVQTIQQRSLDQEQLGKKLHQQLHWTEVLNSISIAIAQRNSIDSILRIIIRQLEDSFPFKLGGVGLLSKDQKKTVISVLGTKGRSLASRLGLQEGQEIPEDMIKLEERMQDHQANIVNLAELATSNLTEESQLLLKNISKSDICSMVVIPLALHNTHSRYGFIFLFFKEFISFNEYEMSFLRGMSENISLSVQNWKLYEDLDRAYKELKRTQQSVMEQERMNAMGQMASGIAHDINNTLVPITLYTEALLESEQNLSDRGRRFLQTIQQVTGDIENTTMRLRKFYKKEEDREILQLIDSKVLLEHMIELARPRWQAIPQKQGVVIDIQLEVASELPALTGNESEIREALINLLFNAVDAMEQGGTLTLRADRKDPYLLLEVEDTGTGMDEEQKRRCLEPFYTSKGDRGTGLGLSMVYGVMQRHGGRMEIDSEAGKGTMVRLLFPLNEETKNTLLSEEKPVTLPSLRILCVDDDSTVLQSLKDALQIDRHAVETVDSGLKGLELFREQMEQGKGFDIVITDLGMPHMDGHHVAEQIKSLSSQTPVILLSGWGNLMFINGELPKNIDLVLGKPPRIMELRTAIRKLMVDRTK